MSYKPINDYAIIGDCRSAALISSDGSLDWLCMPRFDAPAMFCAILDDRNGGHFRITPTGRFSVSRHYVKDTTILTTRFNCDSGVLRLTDLMPVASEEEKRRRMMPDHEVLRKIECVSGSVELEVSFDPRPQFGRVRPKLTARGPLGVHYEQGSRQLILRSEIPLEKAAHHDGMYARVTLEAGETRYISMTYAEAEPAVLPVLGTFAEQRIESTLGWWRSWADDCRYSGPYRELVVRSAITLKLMTFAPSGAMVAAPTTSLPERIGGVRNWDYRYCWLRDASLTIGALLELEQGTEAEAFLSWLIHTTRLSRPRLQVLYDVYGETRVRERELDHLAGYECSRPVRIGNAARKQLQLDTYGQVIDAAYQFVVRGGELHSDSVRTLVGLGKKVCQAWRQPDEGIWEERSGRQHHTVSKVMCWVALDRLLKLHEKLGVQLPAEKFAKERDAIRDLVEKHGFDEQLGAYVGIFDQSRIDASVLLLGLFGYQDPGSDRMRSTFEVIMQKLNRDGLLYRYIDGDDGLPEGEGTFGICSFWATEMLARRGDLERATRLFERQITFGNDVGLFSEEIDPASGRALGNFPQAFTHVGLINAAHALQQPTARREEPARPAKLPADRQRV